MRNLLMLHANNKGADQPAHPRSLISAFGIRCLDSIPAISVVSVCKISSLKLVPTAEQASLSLTCRKPRRQIFSRRGSFYPPYHIITTAGFKKTCHSE